MQDHKVRQNYFYNYSTKQIRWYFGLLIFLIIGFLAADYLPFALSTSQFQVWYPAAGVAILLGILFGWVGFLSVFLTSLFSHFLLGTLNLGGLAIIQLLLISFVLTIPPKYFLTYLKTDIYLIFDPRSEFILIIINYSLVFGQWYSGMGIWNKDWVSSKYCLVLRIVLFPSNHHRIVVNLSNRDDDFKSG